MHKIIKFMHIANDYVERRYELLYRGVFEKDFALAKSFNKGRVLLI